MNKQELVNLVVEQIDQPKRVVAQVVDTMLVDIAAQLAAGDEIKLAGFGTFLVHNKKAGIARNPKTGESVAVPAKRVPKFKAAGALKAKLA